MFVWKGALERGKQWAAALGLHCQIMAANEQGHAPLQEGSLLLRHKALPIILSHNSIANSQALLANLLKTSQAMAMAIHEHLVGSVYIQFSVADIDEALDLIGLADWIGKRGHLLRECDFYLAIDSQLSGLIERTLAHGYMTAAQAPTGLHLQRYEHHGSTESVRHIIAQLPPQHLQHLHLCFDSDTMDVRSVAPALAALTGLTSLTIKCSRVDHLLPAVSSLTCLSDLHVSTLWNMRPLVHLPTSLVHIHIISEGEHGMEVDDPSEAADGQPRKGPALLGRLTQCTSLTGGASPLPLRNDDDSLPPHLQELEVELCSNQAVAVLCGLTELTSLTLVDPQVDDVAQLQALATSLTNLRDLQVSFINIMQPYCAKEGWGGLPVSTLRVQVLDEAAEIYVPLSTLQSLTSITRSLTHLCLSGLWPSHSNSGTTLQLEASVQQLADLVLELSELQRLDLSHINFAQLGSDSDNEAADDERMQLRPLYEKIPLLPRLTSLRLSVRDFSDAGARSHPASTLTAATGLQELMLPRCEVDDLTAVALACELTGLRVLDLSHNSIQDVAMPAVAQLRQLTSLNVYGTRVSNRGLPHLSKLQQLQALSVPRYSVTADVVRSVLSWSGAVTIGESGVVSLLP